MRHRLDTMLGVEARGVTAETFHRTCSKLLRKHMGSVPDVGQDTSYVIYDAEDAETVVRTVMRDMGLLKGKEAEDNGSEKLSVGFFHHNTSRAKNALPGAYGASGTAAWKALVETGVLPSDHVHSRAFVAVYERYTASLARANALDFDDLLSFAVAALRSKPKLAETFGTRWKHILVDEFQDTNAAQYELVRLLWDGACRVLTPGSHSLLVVGDADQAIYGWRGADVELMRRRFALDIGEGKAMLASNFRSTPEVLAAADAALASSPSRSELRVHAVAEPGERVQFWTCACSNTEAAAVAEEIEKLIRGGIPGAEVAVLYRANWQSRAFETALVRRGIPYVVLSGTPFYSRREIKDLVSYLRIVFNPRDDVAFNRIVNRPARNIGEATLDKLSEATGEASLAGTLLGDEGPALMVAAKLSLRSTASVEAFRSLYARWRSTADSSSVGALLTQILEDTDYKKCLGDDAEEVGEEGSRWENIQELLSLASSPPDDDPEADVLTGMSALRAFLENAALTTSADNALAPNDALRVRLLTMHGAKGLEFHSVFAVGLDDGILPAEKGLKEAKKTGGVARVMEEEQRLFYVAITRAKRRLFICSAKSRKMFGGFAKEMEESPFLQPVRRSLLASGAGIERAFAMVHEPPGPSGVRGTSRLVEDSVTPRGMDTAPHAVPRRPAPGELGRGMSQLGARVANAQPQLGARAVNAQPAALRRPPPNPQPAAASAPSAQRGLRRPGGPPSHVATAAAAAAALQRLQVTLNVEAVAAQQRLQDAQAAEAEALAASGTAMQELMAARKAAKAARK